MPTTTSMTTTPADLHELVGDLNVVCDWTDCDRTATHVVLWISDTPFCNACGPAPDLVCGGHRAVLQRLKDAHMHAGCACEGIDYGCLCKLLRGFEPLRCS